VKCTATINPRSTENCENSIHFDWQERKK